MMRDERRAFWYGYFEAWSSGDELQSTYCRRHQLSAMTFSRWKRHFERERLGSAVGSGERTSAPASEAGPAVIDLGALDDRPAGWEVDIALGDGVSLTLRRR